MITVRRWYVFLVSAISLQAAAWAAIALLRGLLVTPADALATAFQIAVVLVALPLFLAHWLWAQRLATRDAAERAATLRALYLHVHMAVFLGWLLVAAVDLVAGLLGMALGDPASWRAPGSPFETVTPREGITGDLINILVLGALWLYHQRIAAADLRALPPSAGAATVRRLYTLAFSAVGLIMTMVGAADTLRWTLFQLGGEALAPGAGVAAAVASLAIGLPVWLIFWRAAQALFAGPAPAERESLLRKFYLYAAVVAGTLAAVSGGAMVLAGVLRGALGLAPQGDIRDVLPGVAGGALVWAYHAAALRADYARWPEAPRQAVLRQLSWYLVAGIGLLAVLGGLGSNISVLIRALAGAEFGDGLREQAAWSTAALLVGLPVWALPWRAAQHAATAETAAGAVERGGVVRKIYLYLYLFVAAITVLTSLVYIVWRLLSVALGEPAPASMASDLAHAIAFGLLAAGVWLYHADALRGDGRLRQREQQERLAGARVVVVDGCDGSFGRAVLERLRRDMAGLTALPAALTPEAAAAMGVGADQPSAAAQIAAGGIIVAPWWLAAPGAVAPEVAAALAASPARKLLAPAPAAGWEWVGAEGDAGEMAAQAVRQIVEGLPARPARQLSGWAILGIAVGLILLFIVARVIIAVFGGALF